jgi:predicted nuclease with RNAse H fold
MNLDRVWIGLDPGGLNNFGVAILKDDGSYQTYCVSSAEQAIKLLQFVPSGVGIDSPLWWSAGVGGGRRADQWIRTTHKIHPGTVQSANSLKGAALVQGFMAALRIRSLYPDVPITESHPKAQLIAMGLDGSWDQIAARFNVHGAHDKTEHERDALVAAICAREGFEGRWFLDLAKDRAPSEMQDSESPFGGVNYFWPD